MLQCWYLDYKKVKNMKAKILFKILDILYFITDVNFKLMNKFFYNNTKSKALDKISIFFAIICNFFGNLATKLANYCIKKKYMRY